MADGHRGDPPLCLRGFSGVADDERIDDRQASHHQFREARAGQRDGLARQPFERAVRAHVDEDIDLRNMPKPKAEREQRVARRQSRVMVVGSTISRASSVRREGDEDVPEGACAKTKCAVTHLAVIAGVTPRGVDARDGFIGKGRDEVAIAIEREGCIVRRLSQGVEQCARRFWRIGNVVVRPFHVRQQPDNTRRNIEADGIPGSTRRAWVVGQ